MLNKNEFDEVLRRAEVRANKGPLRLAARWSGRHTPRLGLIVGKRCLPRAVDRNRAKRVIRESFRYAPELPALDIVVRVAVAGAVVSRTVADDLFAALVDVAKRRGLGDVPDAG